jgi:hypothetical protein
MVVSAGQIFLLPVADGPNLVSDIFKTKKQKVRNVPSAFLLGKK